MLRSTRRHLAPYYDPWTPAPPSPHRGHIPNRLVEVAEVLYRLRNRRQDLLPDIEFGEAMWDMLLALYISAGRGFRLKVSALCYESRLPPTTALRWLAVMTERGMVTRRPDPSDARISYVELTPEGIASLSVYFEDVRGLVAP